MNFKNIFLKVLKYLSLTVVSLILLVLVFVTLLLFKTNLFLNDRTIHWASEKYLTSIVKLQWTGLHIDIQNRSFLNRKLIFQTENFCYHHYATHNKGCLKDARVDIDFALWPISLKTLDLEEIVVHADPIQLVLPPPKEDSKPLTELSPYKMAQEYAPKAWKALKLIDPESLLLEVPVLEVYRNLSEPPMVINAGLHKVEPDLHISFGIIKKQLSSGDLQYNLQTQFLVPLTKQPQLTGSIVLSVGKNQQIADLKSKLATELSAEKLQITLENEISTFKKRKRVASHLNLDLSFKEKSTDAVIRMETALAGPYVPKLEAQSCKFNQSGNDLYSYDPLHFDCGMKATFQPPESFHKHWNALCHCAFPPDHTARINGEVWIRNWMDKKKHAEARFQNLLDFNFAMKPFIAKTFAVEANFGATLTKKTERLHEKELPFRIQPRGNAYASITDFKEWSRSLNEDRLLVPAPFHMLNGTVRLDIPSITEVGEDKWQVPLRLVVDLNSTNQKVKVLTQSSFELTWPYKPPVHMSADVDIQDFQVELPPLDPIRGVPRFFPDSRIKDSKVLAEKAKAKLDLATNGPPNFTYDVTVHTENKPLRFLYPMFHPYLPIDINMDVATAGYKGSTDVLPFSLEFLHRHATLENLSIQMASADENMPVHGRLRIDQTNYKIYIDMLGTMSKPRFVFSSDPYLEQNDIVSVLLYDRPSNELASADQQNVGEFQSAMADKAIGFLGLWVFANTPLSAFSYNPISGVYSASVKTSQNTTVSVGTNWESQTNVALRRRLTRQLMVVAQYRRPQSSGQQTQQPSEVLLQWEQRY